MARREGQPSQERSRLDQTVDRHLRRRRHVSTYFPVLIGTGATTASGYSDDSSLAWADPSLNANQKNYARGPVALRWCAAGIYPPAPAPYSTSILLDLLVPPVQNDAKRI